MLALVDCTTFLHTTLLPSFNSERDLIEQDCNANSVFIDASRFREAYHCGNPFSRFAATDC